MKHYKLVTLPTPTTTVAKKSILLISFYDDITSYVFRRPVSLKKRDFLRNWTCSEQCNMQLP